MHILMVANAAWNIWNFRKPVVQACLADGHRVTVLAPPDDTIAELREMGCTVLPLEMDAKGLNPMDAVHLIRQIRATIRAERPDIVLSYTIKPNIFGAMAARTEGVPFVPNVTGLGTAFLSGGVLQRVAETLYRRAFRALPVVFFQNADDLGLFLDRGLIRDEQARLLPGSGIDLDHFVPTPFPAPEEPPAFLMIARLLRDKGVGEYAEAARILRADRPELRFRLLGPLGAENRTAIEKDTLDGWIAEGTLDYLGTTVDVRPAIAATHCVVLPSYREGAPRTLIEAAAMARPLIATDVPGCRAVLDAGTTGLFCVPQDAGDLAQTMRRFLDLPRDAQIAMGQAGRAKMAREFDQRIVVDAYRKVIAELAHPTGLPQA